MPKRKFTGTSDNKEQANIANKTHKGSQLKDLTATVVIEGNPLIEAGSIIEIEGVANIHKGKWYVEKISHTISRSGFISTLELNKNASDKAATTNSKKNETSITQKMQNKNFPQNQKTIKNKINKEPRYDAYGKSKKVK